MSPISSADLMSFQSKAELHAIDLDLFCQGKGARPSRQTDRVVAALKEKAGEVWPELTLQGEFLDRVVTARAAVTTGEVHKGWDVWNLDVPLSEGILWSVLKGSLSTSNVRQYWTASLGLTNQDHLWYLTVVSGNYFALRLPSSLVNESVAERCCPPYVVVYRTLLSAVRCCLPYVVVCHTLLSAVLCCSLYACCYCSVLYVDFHVYVAVQVESDQVAFTPEAENRTYLIQMMSRDLLPDTIDRLKVHMCTCTCLYMYMCAHVRTHAWGQ